MDKDTSECERQASIEAERGDADKYSMCLLTFTGGTFGLSIASIREGDRISSVTGAGPVTNNLPPSGLL
jgi:hypothetical protein